MYSKSNILLYKQIIADWISELLFLALAKTFRNDNLFILTELGSKLSYNASDLKIAIFVNNSLFLKSVGIQHVNYKTFSLH